MAVNQMGLDKSRCVIVEDSGIGLGAAMAAGISCIVTKSSYTANEDFTGANMVVDELGDSPYSGVTLATLEGLLPQQPATSSSSTMPYAAPAQAADEHDRPAAPFAELHPAPVPSTVQPLTAVGPPASGHHDHPLPPPTGGTTDKVDPDKHGLKSVFPEW